MQSKSGSTRQLFQPVQRVMGFARGESIGVDVNQGDVYRAFFSRRKRWRLGEQVDLRAGQGLLCFQRCQRMPSMVDHGGRYAG